MIEPIPFDPHRFRSAAEHYLVGRPAYADALFHDLAMLLGLDGTGRLLDLGCGPGQIAKALRPWFAGAVGMDPEPGMLEIARAAGTDIEFRQGSSLDLDASLGQFRLVTIGRAFHWMDRVETARRLDTLIQPGGALVLLSTTHPDVPDNAWSARFAALQDEAAGGPRAQWRKPGWVKHEAVLLGSPFAALHRLGVVQRRSTPAADLLHRSLSMSSTSRDRLGDRAEQLRAGLEAVLAEVAVDGMVTEVVESVALIARRP